MYLKVFIDVIDFVLLVNILLMFIKYFICLFWINICIVFIFKKLNINVVVVFIKLLFYFDYWLFNIMILIDVFIKNIIYEGKIIINNIFVNLFLNWFNIKFFSEEKMYLIEIV